MKAHCGDPERQMDAGIRPRCRRQCVVYLGALWLRVERLFLAPPTPAGESSQASRTAPVWDVPQVLAAPGLGASVGSAAANEPPQSEAAPPVGWL